MNNPFEDVETISTYTCDDAEDDGILVQTKTLLPEHNGYKPHIVSHITTNLLSTEGYFHTNKDPPEYKRANIVDLLNQAGPKISNALKADPKEWFVAMQLEGPNGQEFKAFAQQNETGRYTLMLPEDY